MNGSTGKTGRSASRSARTARFFLEQPLILNQVLVLDKRASHHISTVLRMRKGDRLALFNGDGHDYMADVRETGRHAEVFINERVTHQRESPLELTLVQCISRGERMDSTIRQAVELGVSRLCPVSSRHSVKLDDDTREAKKLAHWQNIMISAVEQSGRSVVPRLDAPCSLAHWLEREVEEHAIRLMLSPEAAVGLEAIADDARAFIVLIGPESGLDGDEMALATNCRYQAIRLGPRILRTETAGPSILSILQARSGDMNQ